MSDLIKRLEATEEALGEECGVVPAVPNRIENVVTFDELLHFTCALLAEARDEIERLRLSCKGVGGWRMVPVDWLRWVRGVAATLASEKQPLTDGQVKALDTMMFEAEAHLASLPAAPVSPSALMDFGASQVRHQPSAATSPEGSDPTQVKP